MHLTGKQRTAVNTEDGVTRLSRLCAALKQGKSVNLALIPQSQVL